MFGGWWGAGDDVILTGAYTRNAVWYSGIPDAMNGENGQVNGNGQPMILADSYFNPITNSWSTPTAWSVSGLLEHHWTPTFYTDLEASVGQILWSGMGGGVVVPGVGSFGTGVLSPHTTTWLVGADVGWNPVTNLNFDLELMYQHTVQNQPSALIGTVFNNGAFRPGTVARRQRWLRRPSSHHPLLLIATRSVETDSPGAKAPGLFVGSIQTICDVGGGHGRLICALLKAQPHLTGLVLDLPEVFNDRSKLWATKLGLENRCTYVVGGMFKQVPGGRVQSPEDSP